MKQFVMLTTPFLCMGAAALNADAPVEHSMANQAHEQHSSGYVAAQNGQQNGQQKGAKKQDSSTEKAQREITPQAGAKVTHGADPFITAEFIYWKAVEDGLDYAFGGASPSTATAHHGSVHEPSFEYQPGFKLGFGLKFGHDGFDLYGNWTWLNEFDSHSSARSKTNSVLGATWFTSMIDANGFLDATAPYTDTAKAQWNMKFNALDLELGRNFFISRYLTLRPHFGLKFGWIDQHNEVKYKNLLALDPDTSVYKSHMREDFFGVGIRTGLDTVWYFTKHFGMYGDFALSALWSDFNTHRKDSLSQSGAIKFHTLKVGDHFSTLTEVLELGIGFRYDTTFFLGDYDFSLQAGWEEQIWFDQNQFFDLHDNTNGNLTLQGLTVKAAIMF